MGQLRDKMFGQGRTAKMQRAQKQRDAKRKLEYKYTLDCRPEGQGREKRIKVEMAGNRVQWVHELDDCDVLQVPLLKHQRIALGWMVNRENQGSGGCFGGILADDQGLGKTVSTLALILKQGAKAQVIDGKRRGGTLVVCPTTVLKQWESEIMDKVKPEANLSVMIYHGPERKSLSLEELASYDIVLTTYAIVGIEVPPRSRTVTEDDIGLEDFRGQNKKKLQKAFAAKASMHSGPLAQLVWNRVILDECQSIKNAFSLAALACRDLMAEHRWGLSGTPMQNRLTDLYSLFRFLRFGPANTCKGFREEILKPLKETGSVAVLQLSLDEVMLRRTKSTQLDGKPIVALPPRTVKVQTIDFSEEERDFYDALQTEISDAVKNYMDMGTLRVNFQDVLAFTLRLRQACSHRVLLQDMGVSNSNMDLDDESDEDDDCLDKEEIKKVDKVKKIAASLRASVLKEKAGLLPLSSKVSAALDILGSIPNGEKALVYSQWTSVLDILQPKLSEAGIQFLRLDGTMSLCQREKVISEFSSKDSRQTVLLVSLKAASVGLNLVSANHVLLMDSWWNPSTEDQAIDRVHRIGQTRPVQVTKLAVRDTIEDRILRLQEQKRLMVCVSFGEGSAGSQKLTEDEMMFLVTGRRAAQTSNVNKL